MWFLYPASSSTVVYSVIKIVRAKNVESEIKTLESMGFRCRASEDVIECSRRVNELETLVYLILPECEL